MKDYWGQSLAEKNAELIGRLKGLPGEVRYRTSSPRLDLDYIVNKNGFNFSINAFIYYSDGEKVHRERSSIVSKQVGAVRDFLSDKLSHTFSREKTVFLINAELYSDEIEDQFPIGDLGLFEFVVRGGRDFEVIVLPGREKGYYQVIENYRFVSSGVLLEKNDSRVYVVHELKPFPYTTRNI